MGNEILIQILFLGHAGRVLFSLQPMTLFVGKPTPMLPELVIQYTA
jgi:hypothetical protein